MEFAFPSLSGLKGIGCITRSSATENNIDATEQPFRAPSLLSDMTAKTCTQLTLAQCELHEIPPLIGSFYLLKLLDLSDNRLEELPPDIGMCFSLQTLNVSSNRIKTFPDEIGQLAHLTTFLFFSNRINILPEWVGALPLTELNAFNNRILKLPHGLGALSEVREMNLAANVMMQLQHESIAQWKAVKVLNLYDCRLMKLCSLEALENLEELRLFNNNLEEVPDLGHNLSNLKIIELNKNRITTLPLTFFAGLRALERIVLNQNNIESIPVGIHCPKLESMLISQNNLTELPPDLPLWPSLRVLFVNVNQLQKLPETFLQCTKIERINLSRNNKLMASSKHILAHLKKVTEGKSSQGGKYWAPDTL